MTERLYYRDSFLREFQAQVVSCVRAQSDSEVSADGASPAWRVTLDRTAFYPTSGGQPHDTGRLENAAVSDVFEGEDGTVIHVTDREVALGEVHGSIDWARRFDHMQQHSGSHVLTEVFFALLDISTVSFHMGKAASTLDISATSLSVEQLDNIERYANEICFEDRAIQVRYGTAADLEALGVQKELHREGVLRAVEIEGLNIQACGGTHVCSTGQVGMILIRGVKRVRENLRVEFVCGQRARRAARADFALVEDISERLTCGPQTIHAAITRILDERNAAKRFGARHLENSAGLQAQALLNDEQDAPLRSTGLPRIVTSVLLDADKEYLRAVATNMVAVPGVIALLGSEPNGNIVMAKSDGVPGDMNAFLREAFEVFRGKGGGTREFAQGTVPHGSDLNQVLKYAVEFVLLSFPTYQRAEKKLRPRKSANRILVI